MLQFERGVVGLFLPKSPLQLGQLRAKMQPSPSELCGSIWIAIFPLASWLEAGI